MALPADFKRDVEIATKAVYSSWRQFCKQARLGFSEKRRGTFLIDLDQPFASADDIPYLTTDEASNALGHEDGPVIAIMSRVGTYNPEDDWSSRLSPQSGTTFSVSYFATHRLNTKAFPLSLTARTQLTPPHSINCWTL